jgi:hypothetical protein
MELAIAGKDALSTYFAAGLEAYPALHFEPIDLFVGVDSLVLHYRGAGGNLAAEVVLLDSRDKITCYVAHYTLPAQPAVAGEVRCRGRDSNPHSPEATRF